MSLYGLNIIHTDPTEVGTGPASDEQDVHCSWNDNHTLTEFRNCASCHEPDLESQMFWVDEGLVCTACFTMKPSATLPE